MQIHNSEKVELSYSAEGRFHEMYMKGRGLTASDATMASKKTEYTGSLISSMPVVRDRPHICLASPPSNLLPPLWVALSRSAEIPSTLTPPFVATREDPKSPDLNFRAAKWSHSI
jgi:hypothetical protein